MHALWTVFLSGVLVVLGGDPSVAEPPANPAGTSAEPTVILGQPADWVIADSAATLPLASGSELRAEPRSTSDLLAVLPDTEVKALSWQGNWVQVRYGELTGWVDLDAPARSSLVVAAEPANPWLTADPARLTRARALLGDRARELPLGPWQLHTDVTQDELLALLRDLADQLGEIYIARYGLTPSAASSRGKVVLYAKQDSYEQFTRGAEVWVDRHSTGHAATGMAVLYAGRRATHEVAATLLHELVHLLSWQTFARHLPPWLEEGLAEDLAYFQLDYEGRLHAQPLDWKRLRSGEHRRVLKPLVLAATVGELPSIPQLLTLDPTAASARDTALRYALSAFWVGFLLREEGTLQQRFRAFLAAVAAGSEPTLETLATYLEQPWPRLEAEFHAWLGELYQRSSPNELIQPPRERFQNSAFKFLTSQKLHSGRQ